MIGSNYKIQTSLPESQEEDSIWSHPKVFLNHHERHLFHHTIQDFLIQWKDTSPKDTTWESIEAISTS